MRILHVTPCYEDAWAYGGIPRLTGALCRGLAALGHEVTVCTTDAYLEGERLPRDLRSSEGRGGVRLQVFANLSDRLAYGKQLYLPLGLRAFLAGELARPGGGFDVAHLHAHHNLPGSIAARLLRRAGVPYLLQPNGTGPLVEQRRLAKWLFDRTAGRGVVRGAARVIAVSAAEQRQLQALGVPVLRIARIPNPVDLGPFGHLASRPHLQRSAPGDGKPPTVLYLGRLSPRKGLDTLAEAVARHLPREVQLVVAGNDMGGGPGLRRRLRRLGLESRTRLAGLVSGLERLQLLAGADVVAYPGRHEVFGLVTLEAMLCGTPVVVAGDSGAAELVALTGGGLTVPVADPAALGGAIREVLAHPDPWPWRLARARGIIEAHFSTPVVCQRLEALYREVLLG